MAQVLPVLLQALPLKNDVQEGGNVYGMLCYCIDNDEPTTMSMYSAVLEAIGEACSNNSRIEKEVKNTIRVWKNKKIMDNNPTFMKAVLSLQSSSPDLYTYFSTQ